MRGTAQSFNLFRQAPPVHAAVRPQRFGNRQCVGRRRFPNGPHVPKRPASVIFESALVETAKVLLFCRPVRHHASFRGEFLQSTFILTPAARFAGLAINGQLASDDTTFAIYLESPAHSGRCSLVPGQPFPVNPLTTAFSNGGPSISATPTQSRPGADACLYFVVRDAPSNGYPNANWPSGRQGQPARSGERPCFWRVTALPRNVANVELA